MRGRNRSLAAALMVGIVGTLAEVAPVQEPKPIVWPWIDVYGVSKKPFGTIRIVEPVVHGVLSHGLVAEFVPNDNKLLTELATSLWPGADPNCLHFNWIQVVIDSGNPPTPLDAAGQPLFAPFLDPPPGGYQTPGVEQDDAKRADDLPWFLDESPYVHGKSADLNTNNPNITVPYVLRWYAKPYSTAIPDALHYDTILVLINDCASQYQPLGGFHWTVVFPQSGEPQYSLMPFGPTEWFEHGKLIAAFGKGTASNKKPRTWKIRPLVKETVSPQAKAPVGAIRPPVKP